MLRTLLVDDERPALNALNHVLKEYPEIEIAGALTNIDQALDFIRNDGHIDLLFLDIDMPKLNGITAAREIHALQSNIEIVFVTAYQHFAVEAFEVNAVDYIMKPVSRKRLDKTMERVTQKRLAPKDLVVPQQERDDFLNALITGDITDQGEILVKAKSLGIDFTKIFSFIFVLIADSNNQLVWKNPIDMVPVMPKLIGKLATETGLVPWQTVNGVGVLDFNIPVSDACKSEELAKAAYLKTVVESCSPEITAYLGIADWNTQVQNFAGRFLQARNAAVIGMRIAPESGVYHFLDSGFLPVLDQYVNKQKVDSLIKSTIGKILEHDRKNGTDLFRTMEKLIICNNLQEVAQNLFIHYKTVTFRKQSIEKILGVTMNSFTGRMMLGVALTLYYLLSIPSLTDN